MNYFRLFNTIILFMFISFYSFGQTNNNCVVFKYDAAGNRTERSFKTQCSGQHGGVGTGKTASTGIMEDSLINENDSESFKVLLTPRITNKNISITVLGVPETVKLRILIMDATGRVVLNKEIGEQENLINVSELNSGMYYCRIIAGNQEYTEKFIKTD